MRCLLNEGFEVVGLAQDGCEALALARLLRPDVILIDIAMPGVGGIAATRELRGTRDDVRVIGLSMHDDDWTRHAMMQAGARAFLPKTVGLDELMSTIRDVARA